MATAGFFDFFFFLSSSCRSLWWLMEVWIWSTLSLAHSKSFNLSLCRYVLLLKLTFPIRVVTASGLTPPRLFEIFFLVQVTMTLAVAEEACEFEHRDLHWGNLLISRDGTESIPYRLRDVDITVESAGVRVTLIDFTLSRLCTPEGEVAFCDLAADPELFNGPKGDAQV